MESFRRGRDFSAWLGLVPRQHSTGGKPKLGKISKMGQRDLRRLLVVGAMARSAGRCDAARRTPGWPGCWRANHACWSRWRWPTGTARIAWALMTKNEYYRAPAVTV